MSPHALQVNDSSDHVLIIGAGLSALAAAQGLKKNGISCSVFERDTTASYRPQGYRIKTFEQTDTDLQYLLPDEVYQAFLGTCAESNLGESTFNAINSLVISSRQGWKPRPSCVDREVLRNVLMMGIQDHVYFGHEFSHFTLSPDGSEVTAHFTNGESHSGTLLIGAEGVNSQVRKQHIPGHRTVDTQGACIYGKTPLSEEFLSRFPADGLRWLTTFREDAPLLSQITSERNDIISLVMEPVRFINRAKAPPGITIPEDYVYWVLLFRRRVLNNPTLLSSGTLTGPKAREITLQITAEWHHTVRSLFELQDVTRTAGIPLLSADPDIAAWEPSAHVTLMGDAIHSMPPTGAQGAVTALHDATELVKTLVDQGFSVESIAQYETDLRLRTASTIKKAWKAAGILYNMQEAAEIQSVKNGA